MQVNSYDRFISTTNVYFKKHQFGLLINSHEISRYFNLIKEEVYAGVNVSLYRY